MNETNILLSVVNSKTLDEYDLGRQLFIISNDLSAILNVQLSSLYPLTFTTLYGNVHMPLDSKLYSTLSPPLWMNRRDESGRRSEEIIRANPSLIAKIYDIKAIDLKKGDIIDQGEFYESVHQVKVETVENKDYVVINDMDEGFNPTDILTIVKLIHLQSFELKKMKFINLS